MVVVLVCGCGCTMRLGTFGIINPADGEASPADGEASTNG